MVSLTISLPCVITQPIKSFSKSNTTLLASASQNSLTKLSKLLEYICEASRGTELGQFPVPTIFTPLISHSQCVFLDGKASPHTVSSDDQEADCTLTMSVETFEKMSSGELDGTSAFMQGQLKVDGDMSIAMKLSSVMDALK